MPWLVVSKRHLLSFPSYFLCTCSWIRNKTVGDPILDWNYAATFQNSWAIDPLQNVPRASGAAVSHSGNALHEAILASWRKWKQRKCSKRRAANVHRSASCKVFTHNLVEKYSCCLSSFIWRAAYSALLFDEVVDWQTLQNPTILVWNTSLAKRRPCAPLATLCTTAMMNESHSSHVRSALLCMS